MRGWVTSVLFLSLFLSSPAFPQCSYSREYSGPFRTSWLDLAIDDSSLWAATGYGAALLDRSVDPPKIIDTIALPETTRLIVAERGVAHAAAGTKLYSLIVTPARQIAIGGTFDVGFPINDLHLSNGTLAVATTNGVFVYDVSQARIPSFGRFAEGKNIFSVTSIAGTIYAADGDRTIEVFGNTGAALTASLNVTSLHAANNVLYASDGQATDIFAGSTMTRAGSIPFGTASLTTTSPSVLFTAGNDRRFRALDVSILTNAVELFEAEVIPTGGSVNRVSALAAGGGRVYVAGGDTGLSTYDVSRFIGPYAVRAYPFGSATSLVSTDSNVYVALATGGLLDLRRSQNGVFTLNRTWATQQRHLVHDVSSTGFLLSSAGAVLSFWTLSPATPSIVTTATFRDPIVSAVLKGTTAYAVLADGSLWSADLAQLSPPPVRVSSLTAPLAYIARSGDNLFTGELTEQGTTVVRFFPGGSFSTSTSATVPGAATTLAAAGSRAAVFTFSGITLIDFSNGAPQTSVLPGSNGDVVNDISMSGNTLVAVTSTSAVVWNLATRKAERTLALPSDPIAVNSSDNGAVAIATSEGAIALSAEATSQQPAFVGVEGGNKYYRKAVASKDRLFLFDGRSVDIFDTHYSGAPRFVASISAPGALDVAATDRSVFVLFSSAALSQYSIGGEPLRTTQVSAGSDTTPISLVTVAGAPWVSISAGCVTSGCEKKTLVFDPSTLTQTATLPGATLDVTTAGQRAYALFDTPRETRAYNISDPLRPAAIASAASQSTAAAINYASGSVLVLGDKLYSYNETSLANTGVELAPQTLSALSDLVVDGSCALIAGRRPAIEVLGAARTPAGLLDLPGSFRSIAGSDGRFFILTDYSLETVSRVAAPKPGRRRAAQ